MINYYNDDRILISDFASGYRVIIDNGLGLVKKDIYISKGNLNSLISYWINCKKGFVKDGNVKKAFMHLPELKKPKEYLDIMPVNELHYLFNYSDILLQKK